MFCSRILYLKEIPVAEVLNSAQIKKGYIIVI